VSGTLWILIQSESGIYGDQSFDRCIGRDRFGREVNVTTFAGLNRQTNASNWHAVDFTPGPVAALSIRPRPFKLSLAGGSSMTLTVLATDADDHVVQTPPGLQWSSSDPAIATLNDGIVTGMAQGATTLSVRRSDGGLSDSNVLHVRVPHSVFRYQSATLQASGGTPAPGILNVELAFKEPVPPFHTGGIGGGGIARIRFQSAGVGEEEMSGEDLLSTVSQFVEFNDGIVTSWSLGSGLLETGVTCVARPASTGIPTIMGTRSILFATGNRLGGGAQVNDTAFDRCIGTDPIYGSFNSTYIHGAAPSEPSHWSEQP
jgi:hypothetical protein